jgi:hypothetical protein
VHLLVEKFSEVMPLTPVLKGREGRQKGSVHGLEKMEGTEWEGKMKGKERRGGERGKGLRRVKAGAP